MCYIYDIRTFLNHCHDDKHNTNAVQKAEKISYIKKMMQHLSNNNLIENNFVDSMTILMEQIRHTLDE